MKYKNLLLYDFKKNNEIIIQVENMINSKYKFMKYLIKRNSEIVKLLKL